MEEAGAAAGDSAREAVVVVAKVTFRGMFVSEVLLRELLRLVSDDLPTESLRDSRPKNDEPDGEAANGFERSNAGGVTGGVPAEDGRTISAMRGDGGSTKVMAAYQNTG